MLDFGAILKYEPLKEEEEDSILLGYTVGYATDQAIQLMYKWCERIDKLIEIDTINNGKPTYRSEKFLEYRGFTLAEYKDLFNQNIESEEFIHYPAYQQLGISTLTQKERFIIDHEYAEDDYIKALKACNGSEVLDFFLKKFPACIAQKDMFMNSSIIAPPGSGKTFLMKAWLYRLIEKYPQFSFVIIDPHGDVSHDLFSSTIPRDRIAYFDASFYDEGFCFTYNVLDIKDNSPLTQNRTVDQIVAAIADLVTDGADNKMSGAITAVLKQCIYFLVQREGSTINDLYKLVTLDKDILQEAQKYSNYFKDKFIKSEGRSREAVERRVSDLVTGE
ncbi:MAG: DUF87 domain-containing protein, partial [Ekhidna sp.]|nr:DUF87 domain-containing protein [Ekhidna sp.]